MAHVLNLDVQEGLKELANRSLNSICLVILDKVECEEDEVEAIHNEDLEHIFFSSKNLFLWQVVHHKKISVQEIL